VSGLAFRLLAVDLYERDVTLRLPFRFGVVTLRQAPQAFVRAHVRLEDGRDAWGMTAELMVPKWFDKRPELSNEDNIEQLRRALARARRRYLGHGRVESAFRLSEFHYEDLVVNCGEGLNPLAAQFGPAQLDKAILDGLCRAAGTSFPDALRRNLPGLRAGSLTPELAAFDLPGFLANLRLPSSIRARHTVGMLDPITGTDRSDADAVRDGLPETLEQVIDVYGNTYFKLKLGGDLEGDLDRLRRIAAVLDTLSGPYTVTLDGNEQFQDADQVLQLWRAIGEDPALERLRHSTLFIEQPIHRSVALAEPVEELGQQLPVIIDESDATIDAFPRARALGYSGVSSKACKGIYKSLLNAARCVAWNNESDTPGYLISGEDLTCQPGLAVQQDLALVGMLGITHVERNGHHYVRGMQGAPPSEQHAFLQSHPDLYREVQGSVGLRVDAGRIHLGSLDCIGYASAAEPHWGVLPEMNLTE